MSTLHTINKSPFERANLDACLKHALPGDAILLMEDAVVAALSGTALAARLTEAAAALTVHVLGPDLIARGLDISRVVPGIAVVDYAGFVDLAVANRLVHAWL